MKILVCFGTRPEAIKMAPVCYALKRKGLNFKICVTAQHREMLDQVLYFFEIKPDFDLDLMQNNQSLNELSARIILGIDAVLKQEHFDLVLVHGDTTTSTMVALSAFQNGIKVGHIEAGLRTHNKYAPFPEEINRQLTGRLADFHFAPTPSAMQNLLNERILSSQIYLTGNTIVDALHIAKLKIDSGFMTPTINVLKQKLDFNKKIILITGHRRENFGNKFDNMCQALLEIAKRKDVYLVFPVHLNPKVSNPAFAALGSHPNIMLIEPLDYASMVWLLGQTTLVISDSGGIQEEAPTFGVPVLVTRDVTERPEGLESGCSILVGSSVEKITKYANSILDDTKKRDILENPYGDGTAAIQIAQQIKMIFK
ncbi:non-hydrolyzing UDP-N-acetylglucosamine 2-epimerase [Gelidibacter salicanalis]|uniref:non-hydrolyzing UDP-N-acetylglucosamine 2-epimerase n=1 Tax=Gelidibacter salicanalis TaxID=291193 RepID=UPI001F1DB502|nr:UDP-N-acetylglucosamine 2-epimerase (non-hydrolyzing) [Gelidibacter salicanalis]